MKNIDYLVVVIISVCFIAILSGNGFLGNSFNGWAKTKNLMGSFLLCAIVLYLFTLEFYAKKVKFYKLKIALLFVFLLLTLSKTSIALALLVCLYYFCKQKITQGMYIFLIFSLIVLFILFPYVSYLSGFEWHIALYMEPDSLTGRGLIWNVLYSDLFTSERMGYGSGYASYFGTGETPVALDDPFSFLRFLNSAHNGFIELLLQFGAVISTCLILLLASLALKSGNHFCLFSSLILILHNVNESSFYRDQHIIWITLLTVIFSALCVKNLGIYKNESCNNS